MYGPQYPNPVIEQMLRRPYEPNSNVTRLTLEQPNYSNYSPVQSDPYNDYCKILAGCSEKMQLQITQDPRFMERYAICEGIIKQVLFPKIIPEVLQTPVGKRAFEELLACTQTLKNHYTQEAVNEEQMKENQAQKIQEQDQQIRNLTAELAEWNKMKPYVEELLAKKTEPAKLPAQIPAKEGAN